MLPDEMQRQVIAQILDEAFFGECFQYHLQSETFNIASAPYEKQLVYHQMENTSWRNNVEEMGDTCDHYIHAQTVKLPKASRLLEAGLNEAFGVIQCGYYFLGSYLHTLF